MDAKLFHYVRFKSHRDVRREENVNVFSGFPQNDVGQSLVRI